MTVTVSPEGEIRQVRLAEDWKSKVDPRGLHSNILTAANAATIDALVRQIGLTRRNPPPPPPSGADETPLTVQDVLRLGDAVRAEVDEPRLASRSPTARSLRRVLADTSREPRRADATSASTSIRPGRRWRGTRRSKAN